MEGAGRRYSGPASAPAPRPPSRGRLTIWLGACLLLGLPYPWVALLNPPWTYLLLGGPLLLAGWFTRPLNPALRLLGFAVFAAGAVLASVLS